MEAGSPERRIISPIPAHRGFRARNAARQGFVFAEFDQPMPVIGHQDPGEEACIGPALWRSEDTIHTARSIEIPESLAPFERGECHQIDTARQRAAAEAKSMGAGPHSLHIDIFVQP
jgi:hypothetical protein